MILSVTSMRRNGYVDGHEREDVVNDRITRYIPLLKELFPRVRMYFGDGMEQSDLEIADDLLEVILIFHDESCFHTNDGPGFYWRMKGTHELRKKSRGALLMASGFLCACHGLCTLDMLPTDKVCACVDNYT